MSVVRTGGVPAAGVCAERFGFQVFGEVHADVSSLSGAAGSPQVTRKRGHAALFKVLVHEGVDDGIVEGVGEADGLNHSDDHVERHLVVALLQII